MPSMLPVFSEGFWGVGLVGCNSFILLCSNVFLSGQEPLAPSPAVGWGPGPLASRFSGTYNGQTQR